MHLYVSQHLWVHKVKQKIVFAFITAITTKLEYTYGVKECIWPTLEGSVLNELARHQGMASFSTEIDWCVCDILQPPSGASKRINLIFVYIYILYYYYILYIFFSNTENYLSIVTLYMGLRHHTFACCQNCRVFKLCGDSSVLQIVVTLQVTAMRLALGHYHSHAPLCLVMTFRWSRGNRAMLDNLSVFSVKIARWFRDVLEMI